MRVVIFVSIMLLGIYSCRPGTLLGRHKMHAVPQSFYDTLGEVTKRFESSPIDQYFIFTEKTGNCFGASVDGFAVFIWTDGAHYFRRTISAQERRIRDNISTRDYAALFQYFTEKRIDTITTLPKPGPEFIPTSHCNVSARSGVLRYKTSFNMSQFFETKDTTHPVYVFVKSALK